MRIIAQRAAKHAKQHKIKIIAGTPIVFALFVNIQAAGTGEAALSLATTHTPFVEVGESITIDTTVQSPKEVNAIGGEILFDKTIFDLSSFSMENSVIDLWAEEPHITNEGTKILFAGGITQETYTGSGTVFSFDATALEEGTYTLALSNPQILADDGEGTNILTKKEDVTFFVRKAGFPSPDINDDKKVSLYDLNVMYFKTFQSYDSRHDLNQDGSVDLGDVRIVLGLL